MGHEGERDAHHWLIESSVKCVVAGPCLRNSTLRMRVNIARLQSPLNCRHHWFVAVLCTKLRAPRWRAACRVQNDQDKMASLLPVSGVRPRDRIRSRADETFGTYRSICHRSDYVWNFSRVIIGRAIMMTTMTMNRTKFVPNCHRQPISYHFYWHRCLMGYRDCGCRDDVMTPSDVSQ